MYLPTRLEGVTWTSGLSIGAVVDGLDETVRRCMEVFPAAWVGADPSLGPNPAADAMQ